MKKRIGKTKWVVCLLAGMIGASNSFGFGVPNFGEDLTGWDFSNQDLRYDEFLGTTLSNAIFSGAQIQGTTFSRTTDRGFTSNQLYSTASYQEKNLSETGLLGNNLSGWDFSNQNLIKSRFYGSDLTDSNFENAIIRGAKFGAVIGLTSNQFYSTSSYQAKDLTGIRLGGNNVLGPESIRLDGWNFSSQNLSNASLQEASLVGADFTDANLSNVRFYKSDVTGANFEDAVLHETSLHNVTGFTSNQLYGTASYQEKDLSGLRLGHGQMEGWDFSSQNLTNAGFGNATLTGAGFHEANLQDADFGGADLTGSSFEDALILGAYFSYTLGFTSNQLYSTASYKIRDLRRIEMDSMDLSGWDFSSQDLTQSELDYSVLRGSDFRNANLYEAWWAEADLTDARFGGAIIHGAGFNRVIGFTSNQLYSTASYQDRNLGAIRLNGNNLNGWDFSNQNLAHSEFKGSGLRVADFREANLSGATLSKADLTDADFHASQLVGTDLSNAKLSGANLTDATIRSADLGYTTGLVSNQLYSTASYQEKDLRGAGLAGNDLGGWDFSGQNLTEVDFSGANAVGSDFSGANLHHALLADEMPSFDVVDGAEVITGRSGPRGVVGAFRAGHVQNQAGGTLRIAHSLSLESYHQEEGAALFLSVRSSQDPFGSEPSVPVSSTLSVDGLAEFEAGAIFGVRGTVTQYYFSSSNFTDRGLTFTNQLVSAGDLVVDGVNNPTDLSSFIIKNSLIHANFFAEDHSIYAILGRLRLSDVAGFSEGSMMARVGDAIDSSTHANAAGMLARLDQMSGTEQNRQLKQLYSQAVPIHNVIQQSQNQTIGLMAGRGHAFRSSNGLASAQKDQPQGAAGPCVAGQGLEGWSRTYGNWIERGGDADYDGYDANLWGQIIGLDRAFGNTLLGVSGGFNRSNLAGDNGDSADTDSWFGALYSSWGTVDWFLDTSLSYANSSVDTKSGTAFDTRAEYRTDTYAAYLGGGKAIPMGSFVFTPEASLQLGYYDQPAYTQTSTALPIAVDAYDHWSVVSSLGGSVEVVYPCFGINWKPAARLHWNHDFKAKADRVNYQLAGSSDTFFFTLQAPEKDSVRAGLGLTALLGDRWELGADLDGLWAKDYQSLTASGNLRVRF